MEDQNSRRENGESKGKEDEQDTKALQFLDSMDNYLTLIDSLSSKLREGWLDLASARHSMGSSRVSSTLFDLKLHTAATTLRVTDVDDITTSRDTDVKQPRFTLCKWASSRENNSPRKVENDENESDKKANVPQLRRRGTSQVSEADEEQLTSNVSSLTVDDQVGKERSKSLSVFGTLVSPKLRAAQLSFETALETLVEIANMRSLILSAHAELKNDMAVTKE